MCNLLKYFVYIVKCADGTYYTGYTSDLTKRIDQHNSGKQGARYTRMRRPVKLAYVEILDSQKKAIKREKEIKKMTRDKKSELIINYRRENLEDKN